MSTTDLPPPETPLEDATAAAGKPQASSPLRSRPVSLSLEPHNVFLFLIGFRLLNGLTLQTFFQPDEYFQALEPAWQLAFGKEGGAWITWEWKSCLRSALHPTLFSLSYQVASAVAGLLKLDTHGSSELLLAAPKILPAVFAAVGDYYTWKFASYIYGVDSVPSATVLLLTIASPWQWFVSTRTFSNCLETTLTVVALYNWPWNWSLPLKETGRTKVKFGVKFDIQPLRTHDDVGQNGENTDEVTRLRRALLCAAVATILRPTNILVWVTLTYLTFIRGWISINPSWTECTVFVRETILCGSIILFFSTILDRIYYDTWVFPPVNFLHVNVVQSLATFYGINDWHYYFSQGYPLLLTTALPFTIMGLYRILGSKHLSIEASAAGRNSLRSLSILSLLVPAAFSNIAHKEVRFIYPLLPALHIITAFPLASFFEPSNLRSSSSRLSKKLLLLLLLIVNLSISYYTTQIHNSGIMHLTHYLRHEFETAYLPSLLPTNMTVGIFMPCHSTPWRSHIQYPPSSTHPGIRAWALTCEPPLNLNATGKSNYLDEADMFYADPSTWLRKNMSYKPPQRKDGTRTTGSAAGVFTPDYRSKLAVNINTATLDLEREERFWATGQGRRPWPDYLVFFAQLEPTLQSALRGSGYLECKRLFNSHWHDDWRRAGDVVVWCLDASRREKPPIPIEQGREAIHEPFFSTEERANRKILAIKD
ncbi:uncharacterized protein Z518_10454 [Rhinocladiella mackenziei CBS 650.93]|uniref:Mannosyltransferase n=1 Tax=Rhinocladiella mackenziei CBS 650.93 TaxID=1442369 RepID=A0A0D2IUA5_9EURO|nr:uncharacterized protein Z518_10454 [Rhinocladiella mackenziei CBS 650.93]KIX00315.1 hypothetical protein Z518_10454 [Rhinocladiella mackenziei CBS 650.93]